MASAYVPPHRRPGNTAVAAAMPANVTSISTMLVTMGWTAGAGGSFYLPANHPHIHITANGAAAYVATASVYAGVTMVAISDGQQGQGGGGTNFYPAATASSQTRRTAARALLDANSLTVLDAVLAALP